jgi:hypothetical protein
MLPGRGQASPLPNSHFMPFIPLLSFRNLNTDGAVEGYPWEWVPDSGVLDNLKSLTKDVRRRRTSDAGFNWNCYSGVVGIGSSVRVSDNNPAYELRAFVADYDHATLPEHVEACVNKLDNFRPTFAEQTLSNNWRLIWLFEKPVLAPDNEFAQAFFERLSKVLKADRILPGFDPATCRPTQVWTSGYPFFELEHKEGDSAVLPHVFLSGVAIKVIEERAKHSSNMAVPLPKIAEEVQRRYPNRWQGDFVEGAAGVRFWDDKADNPRGAYVTKNGCYCLTGNQAFVTWEEIFGKAWVEQQQVLHTGAAAEGYYHDGTHYWCQTSEGIYVRKSREDTLLHIASFGLSRKSKTGNLSDAERVLLHIQTHNRIAAAAPCVFKRPGVIHVAGERVLNVSKCRPVLPAADYKSPDEGFPYIWFFLNGFFHGGDEAKNIFLAWCKVAYEGALAYEPIPGQALFICGPAISGKTLIATGIVPPLLGYKTSNPYNYFLKVTPFNSDIFAAGLLTINDEDAPRSEAQKEAFTQSVKAFVANKGHQYHPKFCEKISIEWVGRLVVTMNDDSKSVGMLPEIHDATRDKMMFFSSIPYKKIWLSRYESERTLEKEMPYFARWLQEWKIPAECTDTFNRGGVKSYYDPTILEMSKQQNYSFSLYELLQSWFKTGAYWNQEDAPKTWEGSPTELLSVLSDDESNKVITREWNVHKVSRELSTLARNQGFGIEHVRGSGRHARVYRVTRQ